MARLSTRDVDEMIEMLEDGVSFFLRVDKIEKMKMISKIRRQVGWLSEVINPTTVMILKGLERKLWDVFPSYPHAFREKLKKFLDEKSARLRSR